MNRFSSLRINNEANSIIAVWTRDYTKYRLKKVILDTDSRMFANIFIGQFSFQNADKITLNIWRRYRHVLPVEGDIATANIKRMINAVRRHITLEKKARTNINKTVKGTSFAFSRDL